MKCWFDKLSSKVAQGCIRGSKLRSDRLVQRFRLVNSVLLWNALFFAAAFSSLSQAANIQDLQFSSLPGGQVEISLSLDGTPPEPKGYTIERPARIALLILRKAG